MMEHIGRNIAMTCSTYLSLALLDRFHVIREIHITFGNLAESSELLKDFFSKSFDKAKPQILILIKKTRGKKAKLLKETLDYLENDNHALLNLELRLPPDLKPTKLDCTEANVDKFIRQRMHRRGFFLLVGRWSSIFAGHSETQR